MPNSVERQNTEFPIKMRPFVVLIGFFAIISSMNAAKSSLINTNKNRIPLCSCHCNLNQDRMVCDKALKALETKLDMLIALVSKTSSPTPQPTKPPGKQKLLLFPFRTIIL